MSHLCALTYLLIAALLWSTGGALIKSIEANPLAIAGSRSLVAAWVIWITCRPSRFTWSKYQSGGAVAYAVTVILFVVSNRLTTAANTIVLQYTAPVYVAVFGVWFLGERVNRFDWITIFFALGGMVLFFFDELTLANHWGNLLAILSGVSFGWLTLFMRKQKATSNIESIFLGNVLAAGICLPMAGVPRFTGHEWLWLLLLGGGQLALPYLLWAKAIRHVNALEAIMIPLVEPVLNPIWVLLIIGERPGEMAIIGGSIILGTVTLRGLLSILRATHKRTTTACNKVA